VTRSEPRGANDPLRRKAFPHWAHERVRFSDTDLIGHVNNLAFSAYLETGRSLFLQAFTKPSAGARSLFVLVEINVRFIGEAHWPSDVAIGTGVIEIGRSSVRLGQGLFVGDRCFSTSESVLVLMDEESRRSRQIPEDIKTWLRSFELSRAPAPASSTQP
jgi:acyl-CoA thioester hydrolase